MTARSRQDPARPPYGRIRSKEALGALAREHRKQLALTMEGISDATALGIRFISEFERGTRNPRFDSVMALLQAEGLELLVMPREDAERVLHYLDSLQRRKDGETDG